VVAGVALGEVEKSLWGFTISVLKTPQQEVRE